MFASWKALFSSLTYWLTAFGNTAQAAEKASRLLILMADEAYDQAVVNRAKALADLEQSTGITLASVAPPPPPAAK